MAQNQNQNQGGKDNQGLSKQSSGGGMFPGFNSFFGDFFDVDRFFPQVSMSSGMQQMRQHPAVNIIENDREFRIEVSAPGMRKEDFSIDMEENRLTISAERKYEHEESSGEEKGGKGKGKSDKAQGGNNERYTRREFGYSQFSRSFMLPETVDPEKIQANYQDGILNLTLPKREEEKQRKQRRQINIK